MLSSLSFFLSHLLLLRLFFPCFGLSSLILVIIVCLSRRVCVRCQHLIVYRFLRSVRYTKKFWKPPWILVDNGSYISFDKYRNCQETPLNSTLKAQISDLHSPYLCWYFFLSSQLIIINNKIENKFHMYLPPSHFLTPTSRH